jgi:small conductance mechanosensitive channel
MEDIIKTLQSYLGETVGGILTAIVALIVGLIVIGWVMKVVRKSINKTKLDETLKPFVGSLISALLKVALIIGVIEVAGFKATSLVAVLGAASLAIGLAFQGTLSNLAGGVLLLTLRPFQVGDVIEATGYTGKVEAIHIFTTQLVTVDNKVIIIPNGQLANASVVNYSSKPTRRVDFTFGVGYESDLKQVAKLLEGVAQANPMVLKDPAPFIRLGEQADSSLNFTVRLWCESANYWDVYFDTIQQVTDVFNDNNISIPYPQMDVHVDKD